MRKLFTITTALFLVFGSVLPVSQATFTSAAPIPSAVSSPKDPRMLTYAIADSWQYPLDNCCNITWAFKTWTSWQNGYHLGDDLHANQGDSVKAIANGNIVRYLPNYQYGAALLIEHQLPDGHKVVSLYGHIAPTVTSGEVSKGQVIGTIVAHPNGDHLHFGIRDGEYQATASCNGWTDWPYAGYTQCTRCTAFGQCSQCAQSDTICQDYHHDHWWSPVQFVRDRQAGSSFLYLPFRATTGDWLTLMTAAFDHHYPDYTCAFGLTSVCQQLGMEIALWEGEVARPIGGTQCYSPSGLLGRKYCGYVSGYEGVTGESRIYYDGHDGYDWGLPFATPIVAAAQGRVTRVWYDGDYGWTVEIDHLNSYRTRYSHLAHDFNNPANNHDPAIGTIVQAGQPIGVQGSTGKSTGDHLHFRVLHNDKVTDPFGWCYYCSNPPPDPLINFNGEASHNLWYGANPQSYGDPPARSNIGIIWDAFTTKYMGGPGLLVADDPPSSDSATFVADVTYPDDGPPVSPGLAIVKTWRMLNTGTTIWGSGYKLKFIRGEQMGAPNEVDVPVTSLGNTADISVNMVTPTSPGDHIGYWRLWSPVQNGFFGPEIYVFIRIQDNSQPPQTEDITLQCLDCPGVVTPGQQFRPTIHATIINGALLESRGDMLLHTNDPYYTDMPHVGVVGNHYAGSYYDFQFYADHPLIAPTSEGTYESKWRIWRNGNWAGDELTIRFDVRNGGGTRPNPPTLTSPSNWYKSMDGSTPQLCASAPSGPYYFQLYQSQTDHDSGWVSGNCWTPPTLPWGKYKWHVKVKDPSSGVESDWSEAWYFDVISQDPIVHGPFFLPGSPSAADEVRTWFCVEDTGGTEIYANTATDCSASGEWQWISPPVPPLCSGSEFDPDQWPEWHTRMQPDGNHLIRGIAWHGNKGEPSYRELIVETCYTLQRRRPSNIQFINPTPIAWLNTRTITFRWNPEESQRVNYFSFYASTNSDPAVNPITAQTFGPSVREYTFTFDQDYPILYWRIQACNEIGCSDTTTEHFGIDLVKPSSFINTLPITIYDTIQTVTWLCSDNSSGCQRYTVQVRDDALGEWQDWRSNVTEVSGIFRGLPGHRYCFRARAIDNAANLEDWPANPDGDTCTLIDLDNQPQSWWNASYNFKRNLTVLNWDNHTLNTGFPVRAHFDATTTPSAAEIYNASTATIKGDDVRVVYQNTTEFSRFIQNFGADTIDIWFDVQADIGPNPANSTDYQLYYGNVSASNPPANPGNVFMPRRDSGVVASWYFSEWGGSTAADNSGNGHDATRVNGGQWVTTLYGPAIDLVKDSKQYLMVSDPGSLNLSQFTFEAWFWRDHSDVGALITKWRDGETDSSYMFGVWQRKLMLRLCSPSGQFFETPGDQQPNFSLEDNRWYHVAATYDGSKVRFYVNGEFQREWDWTAGVRASSKNVFLGVQQSENGDPPYTLDGYFDGLLGGIRISNYARTSFPYARFALVTNAPEVSAGSESQYESPSIQPDLAVLSLTTYPAPTSQGGGVIVQAVVKNQGARATRNGAWTMLYADHVPGVGDLNGISFWLGTPIQAGTIATLTTYVATTAVNQVSGRNLISGAEAMAESDHTLYIQADATGVTKDSNRANNVSTGVSVCLANADAYEPNDTAAAAGSITIGAPVQMNFHGTEDQDWVKFTTPGGVTYTIQTSDLGDAADTYLYLYDTDGATLLASNDDYDGSLASRIDWRVPAAGTYYLLVKHWNPNVGGCGTSYNLVISRQSSRIYLPLVVRGFSP